MLLDDANRVWYTVVARFRPQNKVELGSGGQPIVNFENEDTCSINVSSHFSGLHAGRVYRGLNYTCDAVS